MMERWHQLNLREQRLILAMTAVISIFVVYSLIWQPLNENINKTEKKLVRQQQLYTWVSENTARYQQANISDRPNSQGSLSSIVNRSARNKGITVTRLQPQSNDIQVWIDEVSFTQLLQWLEQLSSVDGLSVKAIDLTTTDKSGVVRVRRLQLGKS